jgi:hypothetical protein
LVSQSEGRTRSESLGTRIIFGPEEGGCRKQNNVELRDLDGTSSNYAYLTDQIKEYLMGTK